MDRVRLPTRVQLARFGAPAAFLAGVTIAVLLVRAGLSAPEETTTAAATSGVTAPTGDTTAPTTRTRTRTGAATTTAQEARFYTIEAGDTFGSIAEEFDTTVERLVELNPDVDPTQLRIGQRIRVE